MRPNLSREAGLHRETMEDVDCVTPGEASPVAVKEKVVLRVSIPAL
jgi:hypothetical protein